MKVQVLSPSWHEEWSADPFRFWVTRLRGFFLMRLSGNRVVYHVVEVNCVRRLVYDGEEE